jgi:hypothetical protein
MTIHSTHIDGYDWDIADEKPTLPLRERQEACARAVQWHQSQTSSMLWSEDPGYELVEITPLADEWCHIGNVIEWNRKRLRILWHPKSDQVEVERRQVPTPIEIPQAPVAQHKPISFTVTVRTKPLIPEVQVRIRLLSTGGRTGLAFPLVSMVIPPPESMTPQLWQWTTSLASSRMNVIEMPEGFLEASGAERFGLYRQAFYDLMKEIELRPNRHR